MTVRELIMELEKIENKDLDVTVEAENYNYLVCNVAEEYTDYETITELKTGTCIMLY